MIGNKIIRFDSVDSTSNYVANSIVSGAYEAGSVILAQYQTSGRGQRDSIWQSLPGENLLISFGLPCDFLSLHQQFLISKAVSIGLQQYIEKTIPTGVRIKWPNDILVNDRKIAGILIETKQVEGVRYAIVGLGLNINQMVFPDELRATSLAVELGHKVATMNVAKGVIEQINTYLTLLSNGSFDEIRQLYFKLIFGSNEWIECTTSTKSFLGKIIEIDDSGVLLIKSKQGRVGSYRAKEIQITY